MKEITRWEQCKLRGSRKGWLSVKGKFNLVTRGPTKCWDSSFIAVIFFEIFN